MENAHVHQMIMAYCEDCCDTGIEGRCPGEDCCEVHEYLLQELTKLEPYKSEVEEPVKEVYEYTTLIYDNSAEARKQLNILGEGGWRMTGAAPCGHGNLNNLFFMRKRCTTN